jgi:hypothetical protein
MIQLELEKIGLDRETYNRKTVSDWWIYGKENLQENTADEIIIYSCSPSIYGQYLIRHDNFYGTDVQIQIPVCPLFKDVLVSDTRAEEYFKSEIFLPKK